ncbi:hypothetical protein A4U61_07420 [Streptomyces sp. H-KF8]|nr:hypothetical protein A4U61_07420 [Streptomyces sp. H-KF8]
MSDAVACVGDHAELLLSHLQLVLLEDLTDSQEGLDRADGFGQRQFLLCEIASASSVQQTREIATVGDK